MMYNNIGNRERNGEEKQGSEAGNHYKLTGIRRTNLSNNKTVPMYARPC